MTFLNKNYVLALDFSFKFGRKGVPLLSCIHECQKDLAISAPFGLRMANASSPYQQQVVEGEGLFNDGGSGGVFSPVHAPPNSKKVPEADVDMEGGDGDQLQLNAPDGAAGKKPDGNGA